MELICKKFDLLLNDDEAQINILPLAFKNKINKEYLDRLPTALGEFGRDPRNSILCNGPLGEITYLSKLLIPTYPKNSPTIYVPVTFHRVGVVKENIDKYEVLSYDGFLHDTLYMDMYHANKSISAPKGYVLQKYVTGLRGINRNNDKFPYGQEEATEECAERMLGFPIYDINIKNMDLEQAARTIQFLRSYGDSVSITWWNT